MKLNALLIFCTFCVILRLAQSASVYRPSMVTLADFTRLDMQELNYLESLVRNKRSDDLISGLKSKIGQGIKSKLGLLSKGSSHRNSYHHHSSYHDDHELDESYAKMSFDFWSLKKSIFNTLVQAAKAIKGGIIALKGQLIKGSGSLISAKGKLIRAKGEALSSIGKNIVSSATYGGHSGKGHSGHVIEYDDHHSSSHGHDGYASHSSPGFEYGSLSHYGGGKPSSGHFHDFHSHEADHKVPHGDHAGILILKKMPSAYGHDHHHQHEDVHHDDGEHYDSHHDYPSSSSSAKSSFKSLLGKLLSSTAKASASASAHASSYAAHKTADIVSHLGKAAAAGSAASSGYLFSSKEPAYEEHDHHQQHHHHPTSPEAYEYGTSGSSDHHDAYTQYADYASDSDHVGTQTHNAYAATDSGIASPLTPTTSALSSPLSAAFKATAFDAQQRPQQSPMTDSYGNPVDAQREDPFKINYDGFKMESLYGDDDLAQYASSGGSPSEFAATPSHQPGTMHLSLASPTTTATLSGSSSSNTPLANGNLFFGVNFPLDPSSDPLSSTNNNYDSFTGLGYHHRFNNYDHLLNAQTGFDVDSTKPIDFDPSNRDLSKLLGSSELIGQSLSSGSGNGVNGFGFLPTPTTTHYDRPDYITDNRYSASLRATTKRKRSPSLRIRRRRKTTTPLRVLKSVDYEIRRHAPLAI